MAEPTSMLPLRFATRMVRDLASNNVLRGSWVEQIVAHYLDVHELPENWCYYDLRWQGLDVSVKHSVGARARFSTAMVSWAWDPELPPFGGYRGRPDRQPQYVCDLYVFAWLDCEGARPTLEHVLEPERWVFLALSRAAMYHHFAPDGERGLRRTATWALLQQLCAHAVRGDALAELLIAVSHGDAHQVPDRVLDVLAVQPG